MKLMNNIFVKKNDHDDLDVSKYVGLYTNNTFFNLCIKYVNGINPFSDCIFFYKILNKSFLYIFETNLFKIFVIKIMLTNILQCKFQYTVQHMYTYLKQLVNDI